MSQLEIFQSQLCVWFTSNSRKSMITCTLSNDSKIIIIISGTQRLRNSQHKHKPQQ